MLRVGLLYPRLRLLGLEGSDGGEGRDPLWWLGLHATLSFSLLPHEQPTCAWELTHGPALLPPLSLLQSVPALELTHRPAASSFSHKCVPALLLCAVSLSTLSSTKDPQPPFATMTSGGGSRAVCGGQRSAR